MASAVPNLAKTGGNERFNAEAESWDSNPFVHAMSDSAWKALQASIPALGTPEKTLNVLEIGCGTGLLTFLVAPAVARIVAVDAARGMIDVLRSKMEKNQPAGAPQNITPVTVLLEDPEDAALPSAGAGAEERLKFDLVISHLVLHHIPDLGSVLKTMLGCLRRGGEVALTDFEDFGPEARRFHPESRMEGVARHGIDRVAMKNLMEDVGFQDVVVDVAWRHTKNVERFPGEFSDETRPKTQLGLPMEFSYLLCRGRKP